MPCFSPERPGALETRRPIRACVQRKPCRMSGNTRTGSKYWTGDVLPMAPPQSAGAAFNGCAGALWLPYFRRPRSRRLGPTSQRMASPMPVRATIDGLKGGSAIMVSGKYGRSAITPFQLAARGAFANRKLLRTGKYHGRSLDVMEHRTIDWIDIVTCQSACNRDPLSARKRDPLGVAWIG